MLKKLPEKFLNLINQLKISYPTYYYLSCSSDRIYDECICVPGALCQKRDIKLKSDKNYNNPGGGLS